MSARASRALNLAIFSFACLFEGSLCADDAGGRPARLEIEHINSTLMQMNRPGELSRAGHAELLHLLRVRKDQILKLATTTPDEVGSLILPADLLSGLNRLAPGLLETPGEWTGDLAFVVQDDFAGNSSTTRMVLSTPSERMTVILPSNAAPPAGQCAPRAIVAGMRIGDFIVNATTTVLSDKTVSPSCTSLGSQRVAVILMAYPTTDLPAAFTVPNINSLFFGASASLAAWVSEGSSGKTTVTGDVFGPLRSDKAFTCSTDLNDLLATAFRVKPDIGDLSSYNRIVFVTPMGSGCQAGQINGGQSAQCAPLQLPTGLQIQASISQVFTISQYPLAEILPTLNHEFSHALGIPGHASGMSYTGESLGFLTTAGLHDEYGDRFATLGGYQCIATVCTNGHLNAQHKVFLGWLDPVADIQTVSSSITIQLQPYESQQSGPKAIKILRPGTDQWLWMEYRQPIGFDSTLNIQNPSVFNAVLMRLVPGPGYENTRYTHILDFDPIAYPADFSRAPFLAGQSWIDPYSPLSVRVNTASATGISLSISFDQPCVSVTSPLVSALGGTATLSVAAPSSCSWTVSGNTSWVQVLSGASGNGNGTIVLKVDPNPSSEIRSAVLSIGREIVTVAQGALRAQTISFSALSPVVLGVAPFSLSATATSGLPVTLASTTSSVCSIAGNTVTILAVGMCSITATQLGNATYLPTTVTQSFAVFSATPLNDAFTGPSVDGTKWNVVTSPEGCGTIQAAPSGVQMTHAAGTGANCYVGLQGRVKLTGDFDIQVDFNLTSWPAQSYNTLRLVASDLPGSAGVYRNSYADEDYQLRGGSGVVAAVAAPQTVGKLRLTRTGTTLAGYFWDGSKFVLLGTVPTTADATGFILDFSGPSFSQSISLTLVNFGVTVGTTAGTPVIKSGGVAPIYSSSSTIESGSWVWIFGSNLSQTTRSWNSGTEIINGNLPTSLDGVSVSIDGKAAYVYYISPGQISVQAPDDTVTGSVSVVVKNSAGTSSTASVTLGPAGPSFFTYGDQYAIGVIPTATGVYGPGAYDLMGPSGRYSFNTRPVKVGEVVSLYGTGFGATNPPTPAGVVINPPYGQTISPITVTIGGVSQNVNGYVTAAGEWQINVTIPNVPTGDEPLQAAVGVFSTPSNVFISVQ